jgi:hypothetical protein
MFLGIAVGGVVLPAGEKVPEELGHLPAGATIAIACPRRARTGLERAERPG